MREGDREDVMQVLATDVLVPDSRKGKSCGDAESRGKKAAYMSCEEKNVQIPSRSLTLSTRVDADDSATMRRVRCLPSMMPSENATAKPARVAVGYGAGQEKPTIFLKKFQTSFFDEDALIASLKSQKNVPNARRRKKKR